MDRRYNENRFYDGRPAVTGPGDRRDALVNRYMAEAKNLNRSLQSYGGSTGRGGRYGLGDPSVTQQRGLEAVKQRRVFDEAGSGQYGGSSLRSGSSFVSSESSPRDYSSTGGGVYPSIS
jgi:hypothetical protein